MHSSKTYLGSRGQIRESLDQGNGPLTASQTQWLGLPAALGTCAHYHLLVCFTVGIGLKHGAHIQRCVKNGVSILLNGIVRNKLDSYLNGLEGSRY